MSRSFSIMGAWPDSIAGQGIGGDVAVATPMGWRSVSDLRSGDVLRTLDGPPTAIGAQQTALVQNWLDFPTSALGNRRPFVVGQGQGVLLRSDYIRALTGEAAVIVPAIALKGWRDIRTCAAPCHAISLRTMRPSLIMVGAGAFLSCQGIQDIGWKGLPPVPSLSLAAAQQVLACLIAQDAGRALGNLRSQAAVF
jgi:hypothetical protein